MPWKEYLDIATKAQRKLAPELASAAARRPDSASASARRSTALSCRSIRIVPEPAPTAADVPMIICSTVNEQSPAWTDASRSNSRSRKSPRS